MDNSAPSATAERRPTGVDAPFESPSESDEGYRLIEAGGVSSRYWRDLWAYRELLYFLSWRDIAVRYKQTVLGLAWSVIRPVTTVIAFTVIFGGLAKMPTDGFPYPVLVLAAVLPWQFFSTALSDSSTSLLSNSNLVSKIYFPRMIVPISSVVVGLCDFAVSFAILLGMMLWYRVVPSWHLVFLPGFLAVAFLAALGGGLLLSAATIRYRDVRFIVPFILQVGMYASPVGYSSSVVPERWRLLFWMNPLVGVIEGFRWCILGTRVPFSREGVALSVGLVLALAAAGVHWFRATERTLVDLI
jgi:lipopolysaccharide transport system permease protein